MSPIFLAWIGQTLWILGYTIREWYASVSWYSSSLVHSCSSNGLCSRKWCAAGEIATQHCKLTRLSTSRSLFIYTWYLQIQITGTCLIQVWLHSEGIRSVCGVTAIMNETKEVISIVLINMVRCLFLGIRYLYILVGQTDSPKTYRYHTPLPADGHRNATKRGLPKILHLNLSLNYVN